MNTQFCLMLIVGSLMLGGCKFDGLKPIKKAKSPKLNPGSRSPSPQTSGGLNIVSMEPSGAHWIEQPVLTVSVATTSKVQIFRDNQCSQPVSVETTLEPGQHELTVTLEELGVVTFFGRTRSQGEELGVCHDLGTKYYHIRRIFDPNPSLSNRFGDTIKMLSNGNVVITAPHADINNVVDSGAVYLFNGKTGKLISTLHGSSPLDQIGLKIGPDGVVALTNGNFVVRSGYWNCTASLGCTGTISDAGAVTFGSGTNGISGPVTASNSLVGSSNFDHVGLHGITTLPNGNYVVRSPLWDCQSSLGCSGAISDVGAVTFGSGVTGITGAVTTGNSFVGSSTGDTLGDRITPPC